MDKKIYVLVPVYNVEKYLKFCIDSIVAQTYKNWELILVDDGSTDSSGKICDSYAKKDKRIRVVHQKNQGSSMARLTAVKSISEIENTYCVFCDSDDVLPENALKVLSAAASDNNCDIVSGTNNKFFSIQKPNLSVCGDSPSDVKIYEGRDIIDKLYGTCFGYIGISASLWPKLYKTSLVTDVFLSISKWPEFFGDDLCATIRMIPQANRIATIGNSVYCYRYGGGTNKFMKSYIDDCILLYHTKKEYAVKYDTNPYFLTLIDVEMKNLAAQYLIMCIRSRTYPHGKLKNEIEYILNIPEFYNATASITDEVLARDYSETPGFTGAFTRKDVAAIETIIKKKANEDRLKRFIKNLL